MRHASSKAQSFISVCRSSQAASLPLCRAGLAPIGAASLSPCNEGTGSGRRSCLTSCADRQDMRSAAVRRAHLLRRWHRHGSGSVAVGCRSSGQAGRSGGRGVRASSWRQGLRFNLHPPCLIGKRETRRVRLPMWCRAALPKSYTGPPHALSEPAPHSSSPG